MPIEARHVGLTGQFLEGHQLRSSDLVFPMPGSLCMGFTWSLYFAQRINEVMMSNVGSLSGSPLIHDRGGPAVFSRSESEVKHFVYVDNLGVLSSNRKAVEVGLAELLENFTQKNLLLHPGEIQHDRIKALGVELDGKRLVARLSCDRLHRVRQGLRYVLHRKKCSGRVLEILVGHCTYCGLMNRCVLSVFHNCYKFIRSNYYVPTPLWSSVASELRAFCGLMPLLRSEWSRPWNEVVTVSDASEEGFGVCADRLDRQAVASIGRVSERDRFRRSGGHSARESALTSAGFVKSEVTGQWAEGVLDDEEYLQLSGWDLDPRFPEISKDILQSTTWSTVRQGPWKKKEHIVHLEARALVKSMEFAVHDNLAANTRQLFLVDSMSAALAFDRCRSKNYRMLRQIRKFCSMSLARNISFSVRWVPSELNPADGPSRDSSQLISSAPQWRLDGSKEGGSFGTSFKFNQQEKKIRHPGSRFGGEGLTKEEVSDTATRGVEDRTSTGARFCFPNFGSAIFPFAGGQQAEGAAGVGEHRLKFRVSKEGHSGTTVAEKKSQPPQEVHSPEDGVLSTWPHPLGAEGHWRAGLKVLQRGVPGNEELCKEFGVCLFNTAESRCNADQILQSPFPSRPYSSQGRQDSGLCDAPSSSIWKTGDRETTPQLEVTEGLETSCSRLFSKGVSPGHLGSNLLRDEEKGLLTDGLVHYDGAVFICPSRGASEVQGLQSGAPQPFHNRVLDFATEPRREGREVKGGGVRRQLGTRLSLSEALGISTHEAASESQPRASAVVLRLFPLLQDLWPSGGDLGTRHDSLSASSQWAVNRQESEPSKPVGGAKAGKVEKPQKCGKIREERKVGSKLSVPVTSSTTSLPSRRATVRGCDAQSIPRSNTTFKAKGLKGQYVADFFAGVGGVARACRKLGYRAKEWEISRGSEFDLTRWQVLRVIQQDILSGLVLCAMLAPPRSSFSVARDRTAVIRTPQFPWGLPREQLSEKDQERVQQGNRCFRAALRIIQWLDSCGVPWILENPSTSKCWLLPPLKRLASASHVRTVLTDFCQYGCAWRKRTKLLIGNLDAQDVCRLEKLCTGRGLCSRTHKPHFHLTGSNHLGIPWTLVAQPYPSGLCRDLAFALTSPSHYSPPCW